MAQIGDRRDNAVTGIVVGLHPGLDPFDMELQRNTTGSTFGTVGVFSHNGGETFQFQDRLPLTTSVYGYRARHVGRGYAPGLWTPTVKASPTEISGGRLAQLPLSGRGIPVDIWLTSGASVKIGSNVSSGTITKTILVPALEFQPIATGYSYTYLNGKLLPAAGASTAQKWEAPVYLPVGAKVTGLSAGTWIQSTASTHYANMKLRQHTLADVATQLAQSTHPQGTTGWTEHATTETITPTLADSPVYLRFEQSTGGALLYGKVTYTIDDYQVGL